MNPHNARSRFTQFPRYLEERARTVRIGEIPVLLAHPNWKTPAPTVVWFHGRTASKELDPGRYLRWIRAGVAACAVDLPGHGERADAAAQTPKGTLRVLAKAIAEVDEVVTWLRQPTAVGGATEYAGLFDTSRLGLGGMSLGGMVALRRLCEPHPFRAAAVEGTTGWLEGLYFPETVGLPAREHPSQNDPLEVRTLDPFHHLAGFEPLAMLVMHSRADRMVPFAGMERFVEALRAHYVRQGASADLVRVQAWESTGAPEEHLGFGRYASDAKALQTAFWAETLGVG